MQLYGKIAKIYVWGIAQSAGDAFATPDRHVFICFS